MARDEIGGWCPRCDGEFQPGITDCPDCGIPLLGIEEQPTVAPPPPPAEATTTIDPAWGPRLELVAVVAALAIVAVVVGAAVSALSLDLSTGFGADDERRSFQVSILASAATTGNAVVLLVAAGLLFLARGARIATRRFQAAARTVFGGSLLLVVVGLLAGIDRIGGDATRFGNFEVRVGEIARYGAVAGLAIAACWLAQPWQAPEGPRS